MNLRSFETMTVCFPVKGDHVLLSVKTRDIGKGCWNGYGGKVKPRETRREAAVRELAEESGLIAHLGALHEMGFMDFRNTDESGQETRVRMYIYLVYLVHSWDGEPRESAEMVTPTFFPCNRLPLDAMMPADRIWLPHVLTGRKIRGKAVYGPGQKTLIGEVEIIKLA
ncbi:MAG: NUDIX domain-containing protein [Patescibacteria group bacterium]